jgi:preprotein translocase subunit YajC
MKKWIALLMCVLLLGIGFASIAQEVSGEGTPTDTSTTTTSSNGWVSMVILFAVFGAIFYFMLIRPQRKRQAKMNELIGGLKRGDRVVTAGGIYGEIESIGDAAVVLVLEDGAKLRVSKSSVVQKRDK